MRIESEFTFDATRQTVYEALQDPEILAGALPGTRSLERVADDRYSGVMEVSVGPVTAARFDVAVELREKVEPERFDMHVDGKGGAGFVTGIAHVDLESHGDQTVMKYRADLQVGGRVASVGQRLLDSVGKAMSQRGLETVNRALTERGVAGAAGPPVDPAIQAPDRRTGGSLAKRGPSVRLWLVIAVLLAIILVLVL